jgi:hypothetical protein
MLRVGSNLKNVAATQLRVAELEQELKEVCEATTMEKKGSRISSPRKSARPRRPTRSSMS